MNFFRKLAGPLVALVSVTFLVWLVVDLSGITGSGGFSRPQAAGEVNGQELDSRQYELMVQQASSQQQQQAQASLGADDYARIRDQVWNQWVDAAVLESEYRRRGLSVTPQELADAIRTTPLPELAQNELFQTNGQFDMEKYQRWLGTAAAAQVIPQLESRYRDEILRSKLLRVVTADVFVPEPALWRQYRDEHETVKVDVLGIIPANVVPDSAVTLTDADVEAYYRAHQDDFKRPETAFLSYVEIPRTPDAADTAAALARIQAARAEILGGAKFEDVARRESEDPGSAANGGDLGEWHRGQMVPEFDSVAFRLPVGQVSAPFLTTFGWHILEVKSRKDSTVSGRHILIRIDLAGAHRDRVDALADTLERLAADRVDGPALDTVARVLGLRVGRTLPVQRGTSVQAGTNVVPNVATWVFQKATAGAIGEIEETPDFLYLFRIDSLVPAGVPPLAAIRPAVEREARAARKWVAARAIGEQVLKRLNEGATLDMAARALGLRHQVMGPFTRLNPPISDATLVGAAFALAPGQRTGLLDTPNGYFVLEGVAHTPADSAEFARQKDELQARAVRLAQQDRVRLFLQGLREHATIADHREELLRQSEKLADAQGR
ncbi:MAG TPA: peptidyl-prolyl cis-trans isomerase [Gemmatimonadales bacterium]|nr:peptidyl-prolyl cis-trans isomerase [Gemmatimonadales bacterium]